MTFCKQLLTCMTRIGCTEVCFFFFQKYLRDIFEPADRCDLADVKTENVLVDYTTMPDGGVDIERVYLIDIETALPIKDEYYMYDIEIGHPFWRSPEAHARRVIGKPADVFSFGLIVSIADEFLIHCFTDHYV